MIQLLPMMRFLERAVVTLGMKIGKRLYAYSTEEVERIRKKADLTVLEIKKVEDKVQKA